MPTKPTDKPIQWSDAELDRISQVTPADIERAKDFWRKSAPRRFRKLLEAKTQEPDNASTGS